MIKVLRWILLPFSLIYQFIVWSRNRLYDNNILKSQTFQIPTIVIGNLAVGGAGKSPMTEYIIRLLKDKYTIATLSRGYGRKTKGFYTVNVDSNALEVGDEPLQFKRKFSDINVAVCEDRVLGIQQLESNNDVILLDDAFQHRKLKAGLNILLFDFKSLFDTHLTLPTGNFRDIFSSTQRADIIVITKCPESVVMKDKAKIDALIRRYYMAPIFYSSIIYNQPKVYNNGTEAISNLTDYDIVLFCGIANPQPLLKYLSQHNNRVNLIDFPDHHNYTSSDFKKVTDLFNSLSSTKKIILTTEKDIQRLDNVAFKNYPLHYIPISLNIQNNETADIDQIIQSYIEKTVKTKV